MLNEAITLTLFGMGFVFIFLLILVAVIKLMSVILSEKNTKKSAPSQGVFSRKTKEIDDDVKLAIENAIRQHRGA
jgi:oxaloacetate decarboxylase gamma subunit